VTEGPLLPLMAGALGFCLARANSCTVAAVGRLVHERRWDWLLGLASAAASGGLALFVLASLPGEAFALPERRALGLAPVAGGILLGLGATINRACMLGSISRLSEGDGTYLLTLAGLALSLVVAPQLYILPPATEGQASADVLAEPATPLFGLAFLIVLGWAAMRVRIGRNATLRYLFAVGLIGAALFSGNPQWSYLAALQRGTQGTFLQSQTAADLAAIAIFAGAALSSWIAGRFSARRPTIYRAAGGLAGGLLMGLGAQTVPGGNDALLLWTIPGAALYGLVAYAVMIATILVCLWLHKTAVGRANRQAPGAS